MHRGCSVASEKWKGETKWNQICKCFRLVITYFCDDTAAGEQSSRGISRHIHFHAVHGADGYNCGVGHALLLGIHRSELEALHGTMQTGEQG
jgi:hypothetical protein